MDNIIPFYNDRDDRDNETDSPCLVWYSVLYVLFGAQLVIFPTLRWSSNPQLHCGRMSLQEGTHESEIPPKQPMGLSFLSLFFKAEGHAEFRRRVNSVEIRSIKQSSNAAVPYGFLRFKRTSPLSPADAKAEFHHHLWPSGGAVRQAVSPPLAFVPLPLLHFWPRVVAQCQRTENAV